MSSTTPRGRCTNSQPNPKTLNFETAVNQPFRPLTFCFFTIRDSNPGALADVGDAFTNTLFICCPKIRSTELGYIIPLAYSISILSEVLSGEFDSVIRQWRIRQPGSDESKALMPSKRPRQDEDVVVVGVSTAEERAKRAREEAIVLSEEEEEEETVDWTTLATLATATLAVLYLTRCAPCSLIRAQG